MDYLKLIAERCKASVSVTINKHRDYYQSVQDAINEEADWYGNIDEETFNKMIDTDTIVSIQFYPNTPIGFYTVHHYDLTEALKKAWEILENE